MNGFILSCNSGALLSSQTFVSQVKFVNSSPLCTNFPTFTLLGSSSFAVAQNHSNVELLVAK